MNRQISRRQVALPLVGLFCLGIAVANVSAEPSTGLTEPIYRVAHEAPAEQQPAQLANRIVPVAMKTPFNLDKTNPGEHPLMPALRMAQTALEHIDQDIQDYSAIMYKQERIDGVLGQQEVALVKVRHKPFSVYMFFLSPNKGREVVFVEPAEGEEPELKALDCGWKRKFGVVSFHPKGRMAMKGQKYPITDLGIRKLTTELIDVATNDVQFTECKVHTSQSKVQKRSATLLTVVHPTKRRNFQFHKAEVYLDNELKMPIRYAAYLWPAKPGEAPPLEEVYTYTNIKINNGFTDKDFIFKR